MSQQPQRARTVLRALVVAIASAALFAACGGGGPSTATSPDGDFSVVFPIKHSEFGEARGVLLSYSGFNDHDQYLATRIAFNFASADDSINLEQESVGRLDMFGPTITSDETTEFEGRNARYLEFTGTDPASDKAITGVARFYVDGPLLYQVTAYGDGDQATYQAFVESFEFTSEPGAALNG